MAEERTRSDAARNRELLLGAARRSFALHGPDAPLEEIARAAGVSRTTLHRHFTSREELASAVMQENVADIEARAADLAGTEDGAIQLFHHMLDVQQAAPWLSRLVAQNEATGVGDLGRRTAAALEPLVERARTSGVTHPEITTADVLMTLPMAMAAQEAHAWAGESVQFGRVRALLHRALFVTEPPAAAPTSRRRKPGSGR